MHTTGNITVVCGLYTPVVGALTAGLYYVWGGDDVAKKKTNKRQDDNKKSITASHWMLYIILGVYIVVAIAGLICLGICIVDKNYECSAQAFVSLCGYAGVCGSSTIWAYVNKAAKENEIKLSNDKYRMRLEIAKEIFKEYGNTLDDRSVDLLRKLMSDKEVYETSPITTEVTAWQQNIPQVDIDNYEGAG